MAKKIALADYIPAREAAHLLSIKHNRPISPSYVWILSQSKKQPVRIQRMGDRLLYHKADIEACVVKKKHLNEKPEI